MPDLRAARRAGANSRLDSTLPWLVALGALLAIGAAVWQLQRAADGLAITHERVGDTPVTVFRPAAPAAPGEAPVVLIAHGFAGSQQLMQPFALTLARNGYIAVTFDFPGHGRNTAPMTGGLLDQQLSLRTLLASLEQLGRYARGLAGGDGHYALVGHSMASDIVVRHAQAHLQGAGQVQAVVAVSLFAPGIDANTAPDSPRNLLVIDGALEPSMMASEAQRVVGLGAGQEAGAVPRPGVTYGRFADGTARRMEFSPGVEHIGVLYSPATQLATLGWLNEAFGRPTSPAIFIDARGPWLGLLLAGVVALAWPLARRLPRVAEPTGASPERVRQRRWGQVWPLALAPALLTPLLLWKVPTDFLPILLGDYLMLHFGLYGLLTAAALALARRPLPWLMPGRGWALVGGAVLASAYAIFAVGVPVDRYVFNVQPAASRLPLILAMCAGTLPYFLADEWLTRDPSAPPAAYFLTKLCFLLSLVLAIALNLQRLFFLAIIVPAILVLFIVYGVFSRWAFRRSGHPAVGAVANALAFGCFIAATFPLVS
jgi:dienelactone hydrolase